MRPLLFGLLLLPMVSHAQDAKRFQRALNSGNVHAMDHWVKREIHRTRKGHLITTPGSGYIVHDPTHDSLVAFMRRQPGVEDAAWDKCIDKLDLWPGHSTIGMRWHARGQVIERCWSVQEGIPGTLHLFGWRPNVRKTREHLKYMGARRCAGFVEEQRKWCERR